MAKPGMERPSSNMGLTIGGVRVMFPCKPYPSQLSMMDKIVRGIDKQQNCLLESPTGSGKSLALLCSALAWQHNERGKIEKEESPKGASETSHYFTAANQMPPPPSPAAGAVGQSFSRLNQTSMSTDGSDDDDFKVPNLKPRTPKPNGSRGHVSIMYEDEIATATEKGCCDCQEQKGPRRKLPKIYFGTRTHKQIAQITRELKNTDYKGVKMCILASREHTCVDPEVSKMSKKSEECKNKLDGPGCTYFDRVRRVTHNSMKTGPKSEMVREAFDLEDFVQFCKKAHHACPYFVSRQLRETADIIFCPYNYLIDPLIRSTMEINLSDQIVILDEGHNIEDCARESASFKVNVKELSGAIADLQKMIDNNKKPDDHRAMRIMCQAVCDIIENNEKSVRGANFDESSKVWMGVEMEAVLEHANLGKASYDMYMNKFKAVCADLGDQERAQKEDIPLASTLQLLEGLFMVFDFMYREEKRFLHDYRMALVRTMSYESQPTENSWLGKNNRNRHKQVWIFSLNFWCMNPAVAFSDIGSSARSVVLTSGTLSPMDSFQSELGIPFPIQLEAAHVVGKSQVWVGTISRGPRGGSLLGTYQNASTYGYQDEVGNLLYQVCQTIPHGILCFLSSYAKMEQLAQRWKDVGLWDQISRHKVIMMEPRAADKADFEDLMKHFYEVIKDTENKENSEGGLTGALFMAVVRGKVSEGLDFANNNARAVVTVGIPFPSVKDTQVSLKKKYNDEHAAKRGLLTGSEWYEIQAFRALNQALGRCIRHRFDWGALILLDERFAKNPNKYIKGLSKWVRQRVQYYGSFQQAQMSLREYTKTRIEEDINTTATNASLCTSVCDTTVDNTTLADITAGNVTPDIHKPLMIGFKTPGTIRAESDASLAETPADEMNESSWQRRGKGRNRRHDAQQSFSSMQNSDAVTKSINKHNNMVRMTSFFSPTGSNKVAKQKSGGCIKPSDKPSGPTKADLQDPNQIGKEEMGNTRTMESSGISNGRTRGNYNKQELPSRYMAASQAGGFLPDSQMSESFPENPTPAPNCLRSDQDGLPYASQNKTVVQDTTVLGGSLDMQKEMDIEMDEFVDLKPEELEFSPSVASTQISNKKKSVRSPLTFTSSQADDPLVFSPPLASTQQPMKKGFKSARVAYETQSVLMQEGHGFQKRSAKDGDPCASGFMTDVVAGLPDLSQTGKGAHPGVVKKLSTFAFKKKPATETNLIESKASTNCKETEVSAVGPENKSLFKFVNLEDQGSGATSNEPHVIPDSPSNSPIMFDSEPLDLPTQTFDNLVKTLQEFSGTCLVGDVNHPTVPKSTSEIDKEFDKNGAHSVKKAPGRHPLFKEKTTTQSEIEVFKSEPGIDSSFGTAFDDSVLNVTSSRPRNNRLSRRSISNRKSVESAKNSEKEVKEEQQECMVNVKEDEVKEEDDIFLASDSLNSKRTPKNRKRRRSAASRTTKVAKKVKGVVFSENDEKMLVCSRCGLEVLPAGKVHDEESFVPGFMSDIMSSNTIKEECLVINRCDMSSECHRVEASCGRVTLNARWSDTEKCFVEYLRCGGCRKVSGRDDDSDADSCILGVHVLHCTDSSSRSGYRVRFYGAPSCEVIRQIRD